MAWCKLIIIYLRVERRSLDEQLKMSMSNEMRLKAELDSRAQNNYHNDMMVSIYYKYSLLGILN